MVAASSEQSGRLDAEIAYLLFVAIDGSPTVLVDNPLVLFLDRLLLFLRLILSDLRLLMKIDG